MEEVTDPIRDYEDMIINELYPNPDNMTAEQLIELQEKLGNVSKGLKKSDFIKLKKAVTENT